MTDGASKLTVQGCGGDPVRYQEPNSCMKDKRTAAAAVVVLTESMKVYMHEHSVHNRRTLKLVSCATCSN